MRRETNPRCVQQIAFRLISQRRHGLAVVVDCAEFGEAAMITRIEPSPLREEKGIGKAGNELTDGSVQGAVVTNQQLRPSFTGSRLLNSTETQLGASRPVCRKEVIRSRNRVRLGERTGAGAL